MHFEARNGDSQVISAGSALLLEDPVGVGHFSKVLGDKVAILTAVSLPADGPGNDSC